MAEKKSTKGKVEEPSQALESVKTQEFDWNILGLSSTFTLVLTAILFMIGWTYLSNWYGFFGVSSDQMNTSPQEVLVQSLPILLFVFVLFLVGLNVYLVFWAVVLLVNLYRGKKDSPVGFTRNDLIMIYVITLLITSGYQIYRYLSLGFPITSLPGETIALTFLGLSLVVATPIFLIIRSSLSQDSLKTSSTLNKLLYFVLALTTLLVILSYSATLAVSQASQGHRRVGEPIQQVMLLSPKPLPALKNLEKSCDTNNSCTYGPLGLISEQENYFVLIEWKPAGQEYFYKSPGLYFIPHSDENKAYYLVPVALP